MSKVILDTNFIMNCIRKKFDFFEEILNMGHSIYIPNEVINELGKLSREAPSKKDRDVAIFSLRIINSNYYEKISCPGKYVDLGIINFLKNKPEYVLATYDKELKKSVPNQILVLRGKGKLEIV